VPLAATFPALKSQIQNAFSLDKAATPALKALVITTAIASVAPSGLYPPSPSPAPLIPSGFNACQTQLENSFRLDRAATPETVGKSFAMGVSLLVPTVPSTGLILLENQIANAFNFQQAATPEIVAIAIANAIITYYSSAGVV
jgi:hypothetical protein